ncbi:LysR family transcriptional regulator [Muricoccus pecuniae]|uniref:DNA-binding transcriptional LysR family regulator n=1 Tax=Muricoccus pecuniae TaxID=693023 RepID=A0A840YF36_9PROT|nr:LysR family transcriptional regulator [Roseomonas pecuniae]MBB5694977.1 DNA-binding transcriptional LysR family regulator [Roseomonas pecuniae]
MVTPDWVTLRILLAAAELGSITRAAARCGIATSAAAKRIQALEAECGLPLLERGARGVRLTAAGEALARHGRAAFGTLARLEDELRALAAGGLGSARLHATASSLSGHPLPEALAEFARLRPGIRVEVREAVSLRILQDLLEGRADLGIVTSAGELPAGLEGKDWRQDRLLVVMPRGHRLAEAGPLPFDTVLDEELIGAVESAALSLLLEEQAQRRGRSLRFRLHVASVDANRRLVAAGLGIAVMPEGVALPYEAALGLRCLPLAEPWALRNLRLVSRPAALLTPPARLLAGHLLAGHLPKELPPMENAPRVE